MRLRSEPLVAKLIDLRAGGLNVDVLAARERHLGRGHEKFRFALGLESALVRLSVIRTSNLQQ